MKIFIVNNVLNDFTSGMVVVRAESLEQAMQICEAEFGSSSENDFLDYANYSEIGVDGSAGVIDCVYGGS